MQRRFDDIAHQLESRLRNLRELVASLPILSDAQETQLTSLVMQLEAAELTAFTLRNHLLADGSEWQSSTKHKLRASADELRAALETSSNKMRDEMV